MKRVNIIGTSGSGKSTFAKKLAERLSANYIELDSLFWKKYWGLSNDEEFFYKIEKALVNDSWVLDGNYTRAIPIKWRNVDTVIWIDFSFPLTLWQAITRALHRSFTKEELWKGTDNRESFSKLFSSDSIVRWTLKTYFPNKKKNLTYFTDENYKHINFVRLRSRKECRSFLDSIKMLN